MAVSGECDLRNAQDFDWRRYLDLTKPKVVTLIVFTALVGMLLSAPGMLPFTTLIFGLLGIGLAAAAGAALNQIIDQKIDAIMDRTHRRPLPTGDIDTPHAVSFAIARIILAMLGLGVWVNVLTMILSLSAFVGYAVIYTVYLKRSTPLNIGWGGIAGALPPLLGWTAATGELAWEPMLLVALIFVWTPPHFWALAIKRRAEYARAGIPMLPVTHGVAYTKRQILLYSILLFFVSLGPFFIGMSGVIYLIGAVGLGLKFLYHTTRLFLTDGDEQAMPTFIYSIMYLSALFAVLLADHYGRLVIGF
jgi:protoheme IX farnesyltransferase